jgi:hypothetical protein
MKAIHGVFMAGVAKAGHPHLLLELSGGNDGEDATGEAVAFGLVRSDGDFTVFGRAYLVTARR